MSVPLLQLDGLCKRFGGLLVTDSCSLSINEGEIHALIGPNGAGKTTLLAQISGELKPDAGRIFFEGQDMTRLAVHHRVARGIARSRQITSLFAAMRVIDNLSLAVQARLRAPYSMWRTDMPVEQAYALAQRMGLEDVLDQPASALAHGRQRELELAMAG